VDVAGAGGLVEKLEILALQVGQLPALDEAVIPDLGSVN
jgi:hypothetical protein